MVNPVRDRIMEDVRRTLDNTKTGPTFADLFWCYRLFLLRAPEFGDAQSYTRRGNLPTVRELSRSFLASEEFRALWGNLLQELPDLTVMTETNGLRLWFNLRDRAIGHNIASDNYEPDTAAFLRDAVKPGMTCLDLGANIGYFSVVMGKLVGAGGHVHSLEPFPQNYSLLVRNIRENGMETTVTAHQLAASDTNRRRQLFFRGDEWNDNYGSMFVSDLEQDSHLTSCHVSSVRIDDLIAPTTPVHFVKIDVEGAELAALEGMRETLRRNRPTLVLELNELALRRGSGSTPEQLLSLLREYGYAVRELGARRDFALPPGREADLFTNLVCTSVKQ